MLTVVSFRAGAFALECERVALLEHAHIHTQGAAARLRNDGTDDLAAALYVRRCHRAVGEPLPAGFKGLWRDLGRDIGQGEKHVRIINRRESDVSHNSTTATLGSTDFTLTHSDDAQRQDRKTPDFYTARLALLANFCQATCSPAISTMNISLEYPDHIDVWRVLHGQRDIPIWLQQPDAG